jgi:hypothetical protein
VQILDNEAVTNQESQNAEPNQKEAKPATSNKDKFSVNLKPIMKYAYNQNNLEDLMKNESIQHKDLENRAG